MIDRWKLPVSINVGGKEYPIRYQFGAVLDVLTAYSDPEMEEADKADVLLTIMYPTLGEMPKEQLSEAFGKACEFIDCGQKDDGKTKPRLMDWNQDAEIIIPAINKVAGMEIRANPELHWWTFWGFFMSIGDSLFSTVLHIRQKKRNGKKLDKWESEFYRENKNLVDLRVPESEEIKAEKENILKWL